MTKPGKLSTTIKFAQRWFAEPAMSSLERVRGRVLMAILTLSTLLDLVFLVWVLPNVYGISLASLRHFEWLASGMSLVVSLVLIQFSRKGHVQTAAKLFVGFGFVATWSILFGKFGETHDPREISRALAFLILSQMFGGLLLDFRSNLVLALGHLVGLASLPFLVQDLSLPNLMGLSVMFGFSVLLSATTALFHHLDLTEILNSRAHLEESVEELRGQILARELAEKSKVELEEALLRTQRIEALARLAGGFAHDFNNALMGVLGQLERIHHGASLGQKTRIDDAIRSVERASGLIKGMLSLTHPSHQNSPEHPADLALLLEETFSLARGAVPRGIDLDLATAPDLWVLADQSQVVQVLLNLCVNARDALEENSRSGVRPKISLSMGEASWQERLDHDLDPQCKGFAWMQVEDNGPGIPDETRERIFDPFFTTKSVGKGSGLGLWMCDAIAKGLGGQILYRPGLTGGACFRLYLPTCEPGSHTPINSFLPPSRLASTNSGKILLVDDDEAVREVVSTFLSEAGWEVDQAFDGPNALEQFHLDPDGFRLMILDLSLPGMHGKEVLHTVQKVRPGFPVLVMSGYDAKASDATFIEGVSGRILKPFRAQALLREVDRIESQN